MMRRKTKRYQIRFRRVARVQAYLLDLQPHQNKADDMTPAKAKKTMGCHFP